jgi:hypothetical protein
MVSHTEHPDPVLVLRIFSEESALPFTSKGKVMLIRVVLKSPALFAVAVYGGIFGSAIAKTDLTDTQLDTIAGGGTASVSTSSTSTSTSSTSGFSSSSTTTLNGSANGPTATVTGTTDLSSVTNAIFSRSNTSTSLKAKP